MIYIHLNCHLPSIDISGHAQYAPAGRDLVCAAVSTLGYTLAHRIEALARPGEITQWEVNKTGRMHLSTRPEKDHRSDFVAAFETVAAGLRLLSENYPAHITLVEEAAAEKAEVKGESHA